MNKKLLQFLGGAVIIALLLGGWQYFLESTRSPALQDWEACKAKFLEAWTGTHAHKAKSLRRFAKEHFYSFGASSSPDHFDDHDSRGTAEADAAKHGIDARKLIQMDQFIAKKCGLYPRS